MATQIKLLGCLGKKFTKSLRAVVKTPKEALQAIQANYPGFLAEIYRLSERGFVWRFFVGDTPIGAEELLSPVGSQELTIVPVVRLAGSVGKILLGAAIIGVGIFTGGTTLIAMGASLALQGFSSLFAPPKDKKAKQNYLFSGAENSVAIGQKMPIVLGTLRVGSMVISADIVTYKI